MAEIVLTRASLNAAIASFQAAQQSGTIGAATLAVLQADLAHPAGAVGYVTNDPTPANNGIYRKTGASGAGSWVASSYDRITLLEAKTPRTRYTNSLYGTDFRAGGFTGVARNPAFCTVSLIGNTAWREAGIRTALQVLVSTAWTASADKLMWDAVTASDAMAMIAQNPATTADFHAGDTAYFRFLYRSNAAASFGISTHTAAGAQLAFAGTVTLPSTGGVVTEVNGSYVLTSNAADQAYLNPKFFGSATQTYAAGDYIQVAAMVLQRTPIPPGVVVRHPTQDEAASLIAGTGITVATDALGRTTTITSTEPLAAAAEARAAAAEKRVDTLTALLDLVKTGGEVLVPSLLTTPQATYNLAVDFTKGPSPAVATFANATGAYATTSGGKTRVGWTTAGVGQYTGAQVSGNWDFSGSDLFALDLAQPPGFDLMCNVSVWICFDVAGLTNYARVSGVNPVARGTVPLRKSDFVVTGTAAWAAVKRIEVRYARFATDAVQPTSTSVLDLYRFISHVVPPKTKVILSFDDAGASVFSEAFAYMRTKGMAGTFFVNGGVVGAGADSVTLAQLKEMMGEGWEIASHTYTHVPLALSVGVTRSGSTVTATTGRAHGLTPGTSLTIEGGDQPEYAGTFTVVSVPSTTTFTYDIGAATPRTPGTGRRVMVLPRSAYQPDLEAQYTWQQGNGIRRSSGVFAYPFGYYSAASQAALRSMGIVAARTVNPSPTPHTPGAVTTYLGLLDPMQVPTLEMTNTSTAAALLANVDAALPHGAAVNIYGHSIAATASNSTTIATAQFRALIDGLASRVAAGQIEVVPFRKWLEG